MGGNGCPETDQIAQCRNFSYGDCHVQLLPHSRFPTCSWWHLSPWRLFPLSLPGVGATLSASWYHWWPIVRSTGNGLNTHCGDRCLASAPGFGVFDVNSVAAARRIYHGSSIFPILHCYLGSDSGCGSLELQTARDKNGVSTSLCAHGRRVPIRALVPPYRMPVPRTLYQAPFILYVSILNLHFQPKLHVSRELNSRNVAKLFLKFYWMPRVKHAPSPRTETTGRNHGGLSVAHLPASLSGLLDSVYFPPGSRHFSSCSGHY